MGPDRGVLRQHSKSPCLLLYPGVQVLTAVGWLFPPCGIKRVCCGYRGSTPALCLEYGKLSPPAGPAQYPNQSGLPHLSVNDQEDRQCRFTSPAYVFIFWKPEKGPYKQWVRSTRGSGKIRAPPPNLAGWSHDWGFPLLLSLHPTGQKSLTCISPCTVLPVYEYEG